MTTLHIDDTIKSHPTAKESEIYHLIHRTGKRRVINVITLNGSPKECLELLRKKYSYDWQINLD